MTRYVLAVDPGKATGIALFAWTSGQEPVLVATWEVVFETYALVIRDVLSKYPGLEVVCEKFTITAQTAKNSQAPYSLEEIGVLRQIMIDHGMDPWSLPFQTPADAKSMFPNPALKKLGYWHRGGAGHALDAIRHGLLYLAKSGWHPKGLLT
jgi:hypothetical protein